MQQKAVFETLVEICREVFEDEKLTVTEATTAGDIETWDSLTHLVLINELEERFGVSFTLEEMTSSKNIGELFAALQRHLEIMENNRKQEGNETPYEKQ